ncbi:hypothetical protein I316_02911 [Kwoniella heveanensis BCC8398]|uniref:Uncharacterized protein n=1 Tax=Kwoniella heveanensis BCC8398 TaxID=1296120 RepID=A0A1B9GWF1_9TREE|nr:hypothetical protein I316_02911 [Kwoniella heveanensis BCC8398]
MERSATFALRAAREYVASSSSSSSAITLPLPPATRSFRPRPHSVISQRSFKPPVEHIRLYSSISRETIHSPSTVRQPSPAARPNPNARSSAPIVPLKAAWPWHESASQSTPETQVLQRTLFARPSDLSPPLLLFAAGVWGIFAIAWYALPEPRKREPTDEEMVAIDARNKDVQDSNIASRMSMNFSATVFSYAQPLIFGGVSVILTSLIIGASRIATKITMVQVRPRSAGSAAGQGQMGQVKTYLRLRNVGHEMIPGSKRTRKIDIQNCRLFIPNLKNASTVRLKIVNSDGSERKWSLDRFPYSLDMRDIKDLDKLDKEVVQSFNRLEHVFGPIVKAPVV